MQLTHQGVHENMRARIYLEEFAMAHGRLGSESLLRGHPKMNSYEVTVERRPEARGSD